MRAVIVDRYGPPDVLRLEDVPRPEPDRGEVLIRIVATTVNRSDCGFRAPHPWFARFFFGLRKPVRRVLGSELAGIVDAVGPGVGEFKPGEEVFGVNVGRLGTHAEFVCVPAHGVVAQKPDGISFEEAAAVSEGAIGSLLWLRAAKVCKGTKILVYGASGSLGTAAVQLARELGADITAVCGSRNVELVKSLGAHRVIDYTKQDFRRNGDRYDVILDAVGKLSFRSCRASLRPGGVYLPADHVWNFFLQWWTSRRKDARVVFPIPPRYTKSELLFIKGLIEAGRYRAVIDRCYPLEQVVEATRYVETGHKTGNVVITVS